MLKALFLRLNRFRYKSKYPQATVNMSANIADDVILADGVSIGSSTTVTNSNLGRCTHISSNCCLNQLKTGYHVALYDNGCFDDLTIGSYTYIASNAVISMATIGRFCSIGPYLICGYGDHPVDWVSTSPVFFSTYKQCGVSFTDRNLFEERKPITIGHDVWIGARVFIRDGVSIGNGAIIAAGTVVVKDVPDYAIVGGVPGKIIRYRFSPETIESLLSIAWWDWPEERLREAQSYFVQGDVDSLFRWSTQLDDSIRGNNVDG